MSRPLLFCNVGWMLNYRGQTRNDRIIGGGQYVTVEKRGHEVCNFLPASGRVYGYVQPTANAIALERLGASRRAESIAGVDVVITALRPGGDTVVVGWYQDATVFREPRPLPKPTQTHIRQGVDAYRFEARERNAHLLPSERRTLIVPRGKGGLGRSNVWYAEGAAPTWIKAVRKLVQSAGASAPPPRTSRRGTTDPFHNELIEHIAMSLVTETYEEHGYEVADVSDLNRGWDIEATSGALTLRIEVKGLSGEQAAVELTPKEYKAFLSKAHDYRLCIATNCLADPRLHTCKFNIARGNWEVESAGVQRGVRVQERKSASVAVA